MVNWRQKCEALERKYKELERTSALWVAANNAKDGWIKELESELERLRRRVATLSRQRSLKRAAQGG